MEYTNTKKVGSIVLPCGTVVPAGETVSAEDATKHPVVAAWIADGALAAGGKPQGAKPTTRDPEPDLTPAADVAPVETTDAPTPKKKGQK